MKCPKEECWFWAKKGDSIDVSGTIYENLNIALKKGKFLKVKEDGCYCNYGKCVRLHEDGDADWYEPNDVVILEKRKNGKPN